jgi:putative copper resistance protein D
MTNTWLAIARAAHFAACLLVVNVWVFDWLVAGRVRRLWRPIGFHLLAVAFPLALLSGAAWFILIAADMSQLPVAEAARWPMLKLVWVGTHFGIRWRWRLYYFLLAAVAAVVFRARPWLALVCSLPLVASLAWAGHGHYGRPMGVHLAADAVHLIAAACWPTGLLPLALLLRKVRAADLPDKWLAAAEIVRRFSAMSVAAVAVLAGSGLINGFFLVGSFSDLWHTPYGRMLLSKISLFLLALALGAINLLKLKPRLSTQSAAAAAKLQWTVAGELLLVTFILLATGKLGLLTPTGR